MARAKTPASIPRTKLCATLHAILKLPGGEMSERHQSRTPAALRDMLLPKLLSGELSVAAANHQIT